MKNKLLSILLFLALIKGLIWVSLTPIFQIPDEPSHFSLVQIYSEIKPRPNPRQGHLTPLEVLKASEIVNFNWQITHPVWQGLKPDWQQSIANIPVSDKVDLKVNQFQTSTKRPPLYYRLATPFYQIVSNQSLVIRLFSVRLFSVIISLAIIWLSYQLSFLIFSNQSLALATASLVTFHPMFSYISSGVHYDPLATLVFTGFSYTLLLFLKSKNKLYFRLSFLLAILGLFVKPDLIVLVLLTPLLLSKKSQKISLAIFVLTGILLASLSNTLMILIYNFSGNIFVDKIIYLTSLNEYILQANFFFKSIISGQFFHQFINYLSSTWKMNLAQIFPWYWGVFGWLEKTMPSLVYKILKVIIALSLLGWLKLFISKIKKVKSPKLNLKSITFLLSASGLHLLLIIFNDFQVYTRTGTVFGIQGRYFLLSLPLHMILLTLGLTQLVSRKYFSKLSLLIFIASLALNLVGLSTLYQYFGWVW